MRRAGSEATADEPRIPPRRWLRWTIRAALFAVSGALAYGLVFTIQWLRYFLPHGAGG